MSLISLWSRICALVLAVFLSSCGGGGGPAAAPANFQVSAGGGQVVLTWQAVPGVTYWLMYAPTGAAIDMRNPPAGHVWVTPVTSPYTLTGLVDGVTYSFAVNGRTGTGSGGPQTASLSATPRPAGATWSVAQTSGQPALSSGTSSCAGPATGGLCAVTYGVTSGLTYNYLAVGSGGTMYSGIDAIGSTFGTGNYGMSSVTWTSVGSAPVMDYKAGVYALGQYIVAGTNDSTNNKNIYHSTDLVTWTPALAGTSTGLNALASNGSIVVGVGSGGTILRSVDGATWAVANSRPAATDLYGVAYSTAFGVWVAVGAQGTVWTSTDANATDWVARTSGVANTTALYGVTASAGGIVVAVGQGGTIVSSTNLSQWTANTIGGTFAPDLYAVNVDAIQFLAVGSGGAVLAATNPTSVLNTPAWTGSWNNAVGNTWSSGYWAASTSTTGASASNLYALYGTSGKYIVVGQSAANLIAQ